MDGSEPVLHLSIPVDDLAAARRFYVDVLGCRAGRVRGDWMDVWFYGLQLTLQLRPDEVRPPDEQGVRHFGVVLADADEYRAVVERLEDAGVEWRATPTAHRSAALSGKVGGTLADPSGNLIEIKHYADLDAYRGSRGR